MQLRVRLRGLAPIFWLVIALALVAGAFLGVLFSTGHSATASLILVGLLGLWFFVELATGVILYTFAEFSVLHPPSPDDRRSG